MTSEFERSNPTQLNNAIRILRDELGVHILIIGIGNGRTLDTRALQMITSEDVNVEDGVLMVPKLLDLMDYIRDIVKFADEAAGMLFCFVFSLKKISLLCSLLFGQN